IIVVDSGSQQNEEKIVREFQDKYNNIRYIRTEQRETVYQAWNRGIRAAKGKYLTNANTDDRHRRDAFEKLVHCLEVNPDKVLAYADSYVTTIENQLFDSCAIHGQLKWPDFKKEKLLDYCFIGPHPMWRKSLHDDIGFFLEKYLTAADYEFWLRAARQYNFIHINEFLGLYWLNDNTISRKGERPLLEAKEIQKKYRDIFYKDKFEVIQHKNMTKTILFVLHASPHYRYGGTEYYSFNLINELARLNNNVRVLYPIYDKQQLVPVMLEKQFDGLIAYEIHSNQVNNLNIEIENQAYIQLFRQILNETQFDIVHFHHTLGLPYTFLKVVKDYGIKSCLTLHDFWLICLNVHLLRSDVNDICDGPLSPSHCTNCLLSGRSNNERLYKEFNYILKKRKLEVTNLLNDVDLITAPSQYVVRIFKQYLKLENEIIISGLGLPIVEEITHKPGNKIVRFGYFGGIAKIKNVGVLVDAFKRVKGDATLDIWGNGAAGDINNFTNSIKFDSRIHYHGGYYPNQLNDILESIDVFCNPSLMESYSFTVREALSRKVPVISSNRGALPEIIIDHENGFLFDPQNIHQLSGIIQEVINDNSILDRLRKNISPVISIEEDARIWNQRYRSLIGVAEHMDGKGNLAEVDVIDKIGHSPEPILLKKTSFPEASISQVYIVSIVILTFNQLEYTKKCIASIKKHTPEEHEIVFIDNGSTDGTVKWLRKLAAENSNYRLIENRENLGFAKGCNQGIEAARGEYVLLLNNDVVVTPNWLSGMLEVFRGGHSNTGIVGPMTNNISGPQRVIDVGYQSMNELDGYAATFRETYRYRRIPLRRIVGFCMLFKKELADRVGFLDEKFGTGNFEDDDYCLRATLLGYKNVVAGDVFIHHYGSRSFIGNRIDYSSLLYENKSGFNRKWSGIKADTPLGRRLIVLKAMEKSSEFHQKGEDDEAVKNLLAGMSQVPEEEDVRYALV
ncbi:MAG: glycosyltransferase, partial [Victivallales bacterium]|nr:glycosyltransferase [Victivallales bacterium]